MPQLDTFIFTNSLTYFILCFLVLLYCITTRFLPYLGAILKLRRKLGNKSTAEIMHILSMYNSGLIYQTSLLTIPKE